MQREDSFEELVHGMRWVGQAEVAQGVGQKKVAVVVRTGGGGNGKVRQQRQSQDDGQREEQEHAPGGPLSETAAGRFEHSARQNQRDEQRYHGEFDEIARAEADGVVQRQKGAEEVEEKHGSVSILTLRKNAGSVAMIK